MLSSLTAAPDDDDNRSWQLCRVAQLTAGTEARGPRGVLVLETYLVTRS